MAESEKSHNWFTTIPGILTGAAAFVTALTGLFVALNQSGFFETKNESKIATAQPSGDIQKQREDIVPKLDKKPASMSTEAEMSRLVSAAKARFRLSTVNCEPVGTKCGSDVTLTECLNSPTIQNNFFTTHWSCAVTRESTNIQDVIRDLDELSKRIEKALPWDWRVESSRGTTGEKARLKAIGPAGGGA